MATTRATTKEAISPPKPPRGRIREAQREFTRTRLVDAAIAVFGERGYARTTVDDIAERAGATRATFYLHFKAKSDLLADLVERGEGHFHSVYQDLSPIAKAPTVGSVREWLSRAMHEWEVIADVARPVQEAAMIEPAIHQMLMERDKAQITELANALRSGDPAMSPKDARVYAGVLLAPLRYYFEMYIRGRKFDRNRVLDVLADSWMAVITRARADENGSR